VTPHQKKIASRLGERIKSRIKSLGYKTMNDFLDDNPSIAETSFFQTISGNRNIGLVNLIILSEALKWSLADLFKDVD
jgi:hypothetical protein